MHAAKRVCVRVCACVCLCVFLQFYGSLCYLCMFCGGETTTQGINKSLQRKLNENIESR